MRFGNSIFFSFELISPCFRTRVILSATATDSMRMKGAG
jgi:hypothetical protein